VMDARTFLVRNHEDYDVILLDAYGADEIPRHLTTVEFFRLVRSRMKPDGVVAANIWGPAANDLYERQVRTIQATFQHVYLFVAGAEASSTSGGEADGAKNRVVFATMRVPIARDEWVTRARAVSQEKSLDFDLAALVLREYRDVSGKPLDAEPLTDAQHH
jgi:spermidine synthase